jgi:hypothetical protein
MCLGISSCIDDEPVQGSCRVNVANSSITVTANVSGEEGTQITPDIIEQSSITAYKAEISFTVHKVGKCHEVIDYGHVWSRLQATPTKENAAQSNYGSNVNFGDQVSTLMYNLTPNRKYYVRGYVTIRSLEDNTEKTLYNNNISTFTTIRECNDGEVQVYDDSDRQTVYGQDNGNSILSFEVVKEKIEDCVDGAWIENYDNSSIKNYVYIKNLTSSIVSCNYEIKYKLLYSDGTIFTEWTNVGILNDLSSALDKKIYLNNSYGNIHLGVIEVVLTNVIYG